MLLTCDAVVPALVQQDPVLLPQLHSLHLVVQDRVSRALVVGHRGLPEPHVVDVHVGGANSELTNVLIQRISLKSHGTQKCYLGKLVVKYVLSIDNPYS